jgi:hypothetical protein
MPHYSFTISRGGQSQPSSISDCPNDDSARKEAAGMFADMARDISERLQLTLDWQIEVADDTGKSIFRIKITAE